MSNDGLRGRLAAEAKVLRDAAWSGPAATMMDASSVLSQMNNLLAEALPFLHRQPDLSAKVAAALMNPDPSILTPHTHPQHNIVGQYFRAHDGCTYYCDSHDLRHGFWMTPADPNEKNSDDKRPERRNVSEQAIGRTFLLIADVRRDTAPGPSL